MKPRRFSSFEICSDRGEVMIRLLGERKFPVGTIKFLASGRSAGKTVEFGGETHTVGLLTPSAFEGVDTGIGISPEARDRIFERFYRADPLRNADDLHAGLGLAIVKEYIDLMGGQITVESQEGQGSTFRVELPVRG